MVDLAKTILMVASALEENAQVAMSALKINARAAMNAPKVVIKIRAALAITITQGLAVEIILVTDLTQAVVALSLAAMNTLAVANDSEKWFTSRSFKYPFEQIIP